jgi:hypothetical protein
MAANSAMRSTFAAGFPLFAGAMYNTLGTVGATALLAGLTTIMAPLPYVSKYPFSRDFVCLINLVLDLSFTNTAPVYELGHNLRLHEFLNVLRLKWTRNVLFTFSFRIDLLCNFERIYEIPYIQFSLS